MYTYIDSVSLYRSTGAQWEHIDLQNIQVSVIYNRFVKVYLTLLDSNTNSNIYVDMDSLKSSYSTYSGTLNELLIELNNTPLVTVNDVPNSLIKHARYSDAVRTGYKINLTKAGVIIPSNFPKDELNDIEITRPTYDTQLSLLHSHCLISINGYFHMTDTDGTKAFVYDAGKTLRKSNYNEVGITSFLDLGKLTKIKLNPNDIRGDGVTGPLKDNLYFTVNESLDNKSYILVLGGYLIFPSDGIFWRNGDNSFAVKLNKIPYVERIYESKNYIDISELQLTEDVNNPNTYLNDELWSDEVLRRYFTMSQSYLVIIDNPNITTNKIHIRHSSMPGMFTCYQDPVFPLFGGHGKLLEYWKVYEDDRWSVTVRDNYLRNYIISYQNNSNAQTLNNNLLPMKPFEYSRGYLLDILGF